MLSAFGVVSWGGAPNRASAGSPGLLPSARSLVLGPANLRPLDDARGRIGALGAASLGTAGGVQCAVGLRCGGSVPPRLPSLAGTGHPSQCRRLSVSSLGVVHRFGCPRGPQGCCRLLVRWFWDQRTYGPRMTTAGAGVCLEPPV